MFIINISHDIIDNLDTFYYNIVTCSNLESIFYCLQINKTAYYEEPSCTQVFNFNIKDASTPNMSQFKKPNSIDQSNKFSVPKFAIDESVIEQSDQVSNKRDECSRQTDQHTVNNQGDGLSVIMEATREYNR